MERYIARQPIFDNKIKVSAYELLYRGSSVAVSADITDGDAATRSLLSDAITVFGLSNLTNSKPAFVNFTENLILDGFVKLTDAKEVAVELLETIKITPELLERLGELKQLGYQLVLDDYIGDPYFDDVLPYVNVIKVDFLGTDRSMQQRIARRFKDTGQILLAEKVETKEVFDDAVQMGYSLFQGYFFEKPMLLQKTSSALAASTYVRMFRELAKREIDITRCGHLIHADAVLTYQLFRKVRTLRYYRGNSVQSITQALVLLGTDEIRRWITLLLARERNVTYSDELVRSAYLRAVFTERLMEYSPMAHRCSDGFLLGMFSLLDRILGISLNKILKDIPIAQDVTAALLDTEKNLFSTFLEFLLIYEMKNPALILPSLDIRLEPSQIATLYMQCIVEADKAFNY